MAYKRGHVTLIGASGGPAPPQHGAGAPPAHYPPLSAANHNQGREDDATTVFVRPSEASWVSQLSSMVRRETMEVVQGLDAPPVDQVARGAPARSSRQRALPAPPRRQSRPPDLPAPPRRAAHAAAVRSQPLPAARSGRSMPPRPRTLDAEGVAYAVEGSLARSLRPTGTRRRPWLGLALPPCAALVVLAMWNTPQAQWPYWKLTFADAGAQVTPTRPAPAPLPRPASQLPPPATSTHALPARPASAPLPRPAAELPPPITRPAADPAPGAPDEAKAEPAIEIQLEPSTPSAQATDDGAEVAEAPALAPPSHVHKRRHRRRASARRRARPSRPITPLTTADPAPTKPEEDFDGPLGTLQLNSRPWSQVFIDGEFVGHTPVLGLMLKPGPHRVRLVNAAFGMSKELQVQVAGGRTVKYVELLDDNR